jgi:hypothetical protein
VVAEEEASVDGGNGDWQSAASMVAVVNDREESGRDLERGGDLEGFGIKSETT